MNARSVRAKCRSVGAARFLGWLLVLSTGLAGCTGMGGARMEATDEWLMRTTLPFCAIYEDNLFDLRDWFSRPQLATNNKVPSPDTPFGQATGYRGAASITPLEAACGRVLPPFMPVYNPRIALVLLDLGADARGRAGVQSPLEAVRARSPRTAEDEELIRALIAHGGEQTRP